MARHFVTQHVIVWQRPIGYNFAGRPLSPMRGRQARAAAQIKTFPIDFANKLPVAERGPRCKIVVRLRSTIRMAYLQAAVLFEICTGVFSAWRPFPEWQGRA
jgi:hypothetical protein